MAKQRLIILSDIFGGENPKWISDYARILESKFEIKYYDVIKLAEIDASEVDIHNQFINGGIERAVQNLLNLEREPVSVLGFSIGGTIVWKSVLRGLKCSQLIAVSSTRLRFETEVPNCKINLYYGELDLNTPKTEWFLDLKIVNQIFEDQGHHLYLEKKNAIVICGAIL